MRSLSALLIVSLLAVLAACSSARQTAGVQLPGESPRAANGLQVPPDAWEHPPQVANAPRPTAG